ncbi:mesothelin-like [Petaurus breviceps papuanus]|uniref:mesothelin-like n=1 Tax=Petaurus breviceps papuanus TaxID=3040969 RepID=UPI0036DAED7B
MGVQGVDVKTPKQMAHLIVTSNLHSLESSQDILEVLSRDLCIDVSTFMTQFNEYAHQAHLNALPNATVGAAILKAVLDRLSPSSHLFPASVWAEWFQQQLPLLLPFEIEAFTDLLSKETFQTLGALAVELTPSMLLSKADGQMLNRTLPVLSTIRDWSPAQASIIVKKLLQNGLQLTQTRDVLTLGTLASGLPSSEVSQLSDDAILQLAADENFINILQGATESLQHAFVHRILQSNEGKIFPRVPAGLASQIPLSQLLSSQLDIDKINKMLWTPAQAQVLFQTVLKSPLKYSQLSSSLLQGFSCGAANFLKQIEFAELIRVLASKHIRIDKNQLSCTAKRLTGFIKPSDFEEYPADILLSLGMEKDFGPDNCEKYFRQIGQVHFDILKKETLKWKTLMDQAEHCLGISNDSLSKKHLQILGNLSCALNDSQIKKSDPYILQVLQYCSSFTASQVTAIQHRLKDIFGSPSTWTASTLQGMGNLASILDSNILQRIPEAWKTQFFPNFLSWLKIHNKEQFMYSLKQLKGTQRNKRDTTPCSGVPLTADRVRKERDMIAASYTSSSDLEACLPDSVLKNHLELFGSMEFEDPLLQVLKMKLDKMLGVLPEDYLPLLGHIAKAYQPSEMARWNVTASDTLVALLRGTSWLNHDEKVNEMVNQYLKGNHTQLRGTVLTALDPHICALEDHLLQQLSPEDIWELSTPLDISQCSQRKKNLIYHQVKATVQEHQNAQNAYYQMLKSLLGGAPSEDLIQFAADSPVMAMDTFTALNPEEVKKLSPQNLKDLLDINLSELNTIVEHPTVQAWVKAHTQSEVNAIGLKVMAGHPDPTPDGSFVLTSAPPISRAEGALMKEHRLQISYTILLALWGVMISLGAS